MRRAPRRATHIWQNHYRSARAFAVIPCAFGLAASGAPLRVSGLDRSARPRSNLVPPYRMERYAPPPHIYAPVERRGPKRKKERRVEGLDTTSCEAGQLRCRREGNERIRPAFASLVVLLQGRFRYHPHC